MSNSSPAILYGNCTLIGNLRPNRYAISVSLSKFTKFLTDITLKLLRRHVSVLPRDSFVNKACATLELVTLQYHRVDIENKSLQFLSRSARFCNGAPSNHSILTRLEVTSVTLLKKPNTMPNTLAVTYRSIDFYSRTFHVASFRGHPVPAYSPTISEEDQQCQS